VPSIDAFPTCASELHPGAAPRDFALRINGATDKRSTPGPAPLCGDNNMESLKQVAPSVGLVVAWGGTALLVSPNIEATSRHEVLVILDGGTFSPREPCGFILAL
jgi:hypothetical protein